MKTIIHVNQHNIKANAKGEDKPVLTCKTYKSNIYTNEAIIYGLDGRVAAKIIYSPDNPLSCGAKVWIETFGKVKTVTKEEPKQIESDEWLFKGCIIQKSEHPKIVGKYEVFKNDKLQTHIGRCNTFTEAKKLCIKNECFDNFQEW